MYCHHLLRPTPATFSPIIKLKTQNINHITTMYIHLPANIFSLVATPCINVVYETTSGLPGLPVSDPAMEGENVVDG